MLIKKMCTKLMNANYIMFICSKINVQLIYLTLVNGEINTREYLNHGRYGAFVIVQVHHQKGIEL